MAEFSLPANSIVKPGKTFEGATGAKNTRRFIVYRYDPDTGENPRTDTYEVDMDHCGPMVLDGLLKIKNEMDPTLSLRRSCREGICGSCAMNIDGANTLACTMAIAEIKGDIKVYPLPHQPIIKDLVSDLSNFYAQYASVEPWMKTTSATPPDRERLQSKQDRENLMGCMNVSCARVVLPVAQAIGGTVTVTWDLPPCSTLTAGLSIHVMRQPVNAWTSLKTLSSCIAAIRL